MRGKPPWRLTNAVRRFIVSLETGATPLWLPFSFASHDYRVGYCLSNCEAEHRRTSAQILFGWLIWQVRGQSFMEAEFHAVVKRGHSIEDITPRADGERLVMFVPDLLRVAVRMDDRTWKTWSNHKKLGGVLESTRPLLLRDTAPNLLG